MKLSVSNLWIRKQAGGVLCDALQVLSVGDVNPLFQNSQCRHPDKAPV